MGYQKQILLKTPLFFPVDVKGTEPRLAGVQLLKQRK